MVTYELIPKQVLDEALEAIQNAKISLEYLAPGDETEVVMSNELDKVYNKIQMNRTGCNVQPAGTEPN